MSDTGGRRSRLEYIGKSLGPMRSAKCPLCDKDFFKRLGLESHLIQTHKLGGQEKLDILDAAFPRSQGKEKK